MGAVYEAVQEDLGRRVAVKVLHERRLASTSALARFRVEAETAARLGSPHIVLVTDFQTNTGEPPFLVMELLSGRSLGQIISEEGVLSWQRAASIGTQVLAALAAAHDAKIIHRDIKPDNIFVTRSLAIGDMVKVLDFGVAKLTETDAPPITGEGVLLGTPQYMSPEQASGGVLDVRTDLYAVAVCLYEATSGHLPIEASTSRVQLDDVIHREPAPLDRWCPNADPVFVAIVTRALAKNPDARFQSASEMAAALASMLGIAPLPSGAPTLPQARTNVPTKDESATSAPIAASAAIATRPIVETLVVSMATPSAVADQNPATRLSPSPNPFPSTRVSPSPDPSPSQSPFPFPSLFPNPVPFQFPSQAPLQSPSRSPSPLLVDGYGSDGRVAVVRAPKRSRWWLWISLFLAVVVLVPVGGVFAIFGYYVHVTSVCEDTRASAEERIDACETACSKDESNVKYCTMRGDLLVSKGLTASADKQYDEACSGGDKAACTKLASLRSVPPK